jgi:D-hydroxyproline dehydrogenase subunit gamma
MSEIRVVIDGETVEVEQGATVAAALALCRKSARLSVSGEPRSPMCGMGVCQECRVSIDGRAHVLACQTLCREGQNISTGAKAVQ